MDNKKLILISAALICVLGISAVVYHNCKQQKEVTEETGKLKTVSESSVQQVQENTDLKEKGSKKTILNASVQQEESLTKKANLYDDIASSAIPLSAISAISDLPVNIQDAVTKIAENNNIYMIQKNNDKILVITDNPENIRHSIEFTEISLSNGHQTQTTLGYNDKISDSDNDKWEYNEETQQPVKHIKYNGDGDIEFTEVWNYGSENPVKYEMKDAEGRVISMRKETQQGDTDLRVEHLVYDKDGNTKLNVSATYDGEDIKRFTYYNADKPNISGSIFSDYTDGLRTKETVYTSDLKVKEVYTSEYKDGTREEIIKWNNDNMEVQKLVPSD